MLTLLSRGIESRLTFFERGLIFITTRVSLLTPTKGSVPAPFESVPIRRMFFFAGANGRFVV